jgi:modulator of FtsH protease HflK
MPWSNQGGGGPWGSGGGKGPWGSGPQPTGGGGGGGSPPDLEDFLRRGQDKLRTVLPGGNLGGTGFALIALVAFLFWLGSGFFSVNPNE